MSYQLSYSAQANKHIEFHRKSGNKPILKKLLVLFEEPTEHPTIGTGKPEQLKHNLTGYWSRRINQEHRLVYKTLDDNIVRVYSARHY